MKHDANPRDGEQPINYLLKEYRECSNVFIETGTGMGGTLRKAADIYEYCISIEYSPQMYADIMNEFDGIDNVELLYGNSELLLGPAIQSGMKKNPEALVLWLDAHVCDPDRAVEGQNTSAAELEMEQWELYADRVKLYTLIDDARLFDGDLYPSQGWIKKVAERHGYTYSLENDVMILLPCESPSLV